MCTDNEIKAMLEEIDKELEPVWLDILNELPNISWEDDPPFKHLTVKQLREMASKKSTPKELVIASIARSELNRRGFNN